MNKKTHLTSVNVDREIHREFKILCIKENITFQKVVNTTIKLYLTDKKFRKIINNK